MHFNFVQILVFLLIFTILIVFHELGHFLAAKAFRMKVHEFAIGFFQPKFRYAFDGETEYTIRAFPLGGFVRIAGMEIEDEQATQGTPDKSDGAETTNMRALNQEAAEVDGKVQDGFNTRPVFQRFIVYLAGPVFSFLLGWLALCLIGCTVGLVTKTQVGVGKVTPDSIAAQAGIRQGDVIVGVNGSDVSDTVEVLSTIQTSAGKPVVLRVRREDGTQTRDVTVTPKAEKADGGKVVGRIGFVVDEIPLAVQRVSVPESFTFGNTRTVEWFQSLPALFSPGQIKNSLGGPVAIFRETQTATNRGGPLPMALLGQLSLSLGLFNLFPIPVLDGGHLTLLTLEAIRRRKLTSGQTIAVQLTGFAMLAALFLFVMFKDIFMRG